MTIKEFAERMNLSYEDAEKIVEIHREELVYCMEYHIIIDDIKYVDENSIGYWITVPGKSFQRSEDDIEMSGEYLATKYKELVLKRLNVIAEDISEDNITFHYHIDNDFEWTEDEYKNVMAYAIQKMATDECYPISFDLKGGEE